MWIFAESTQPWWAALITGTGGTVIILAIIAKTLWEETKSQRTEINQIAKTSIEVITKILEREAENKRIVEDIKDVLSKIDEKLK